MQPVITQGVVSMAKLIGSEINAGNYGEDTFCKVLMESFPDTYIIYRNRQVFGREFDILVYSQFS